METLKHYPFLYHENMKRLQSREANGIANNIKRLFAEHRISESDTIILNLLCKYGYLNAFMVRVLLEQDLSECNQAYVRNRLAFLESMGLVSRFQFIYRDEKGIEHFTPFIYEAAYKAKCLFMEHVRVDPNERDDTILRRLSFNQFHIFFKKQMGKALTFSASHFNGKSDGTYRFSSQGRQVTFHVFSLNREENWHCSFLERLKALDADLKNKGVAYSGIIVICENEMQSLAAEKYRKSVAECKELPLYYICDHAVVMEDHLLSHLIYVRPDKNYTSYDIIKVPVDGIQKSIGNNT